MYFETRRVNLWERLHLKLKRAALSISNGPPMKSSGGSRSRHAAGGFFCLVCKVVHIVVPEMPGIMPQLKLIQEGRDRKSHRVKPLP